MTAEEIDAALRLARKMRRARNPNVVELAEALEKACSELRLRIQNEEENAQTEAWLRARAQIVAGAMGGRDALDL